MILDEGGSRFLGLGWCLRADVEAELGELLVQVVALHLDLLQMGGVARHGDGGAGGGYDGNLGVVGEDDRHDYGVLQVGFVFELALGEADGVDPSLAHEAVDIELALVEVLELTFQLKDVVAVVARDKEGED